MPVSSQGLPPGGAGIGRLMKMVDGRGNHGRRGVLDELRCMQVTWGEFGGRWGSEHGK